MVELNKGYFFYSLAYVCLIVPPPFDEKVILSPLNYLNNLSELIDLTDPLELCLERALIRACVYMCSVEKEDILL